MAKQTFTTGQVLTAAQVNALQANDFNQTVSAKTASYVLVAADKGTRIEFSTSGSVTCTVNTGLFDAGDTVFIQNTGAGVVTITAGTATVNTSASLAINQYEGGVLYFVSASSAIWFEYASTATGDITAVTAGTGLSGGGTGGDVTLSLTTPVSATNGGTAQSTYATGDLLFASATNTLSKRTIGSTGQVLTVSGGVPTWATATAAGTNWSLVSSANTTSGSTVTVSGITGADKLLVLFRGVSTNSSGSFLNVRINSTTANYQIVSNEYRWGNTYSVNNYTAVLNTDKIPCAQLPNTVDTATGFGQIVITGGNASGPKVIQYSGGTTPNGGTDHIHYIGGGYWNDSSTISSISIIAGNTFDAGVIEVYKSA